MSDVEDRPEDVDGPAPEQPAPDSAAWPSSSPSVDGESEAIHEPTGAPAEPAAAPAVPEGAVASGPVAPDTPPGTDVAGPDISTDVPPASAVPEGTDRSEQPVAPARWVAATAGAAASPPVADDGGVPEPIAPAAALPLQAATGGPGAPEQPAAYGGWSARPAVRVDERSDAQGWPEPARQDGPGGLPPAPAAPARPTAADHPPHGQSRNPVDRLTRGLPHPLRVTIDWIVTIVGAVAIVLLVKAFVVNPYRIPSSSMETTLHCAQPAVGCQARFSDRVLANRFLYRLRDPRRGEIIVFETPPAARLKCGAGGTFVKRVIGLPGETVEVRLRNGDGYVYINGNPLKEPYVDTTRRGAVQEFGPVRVKPENYFMMGDNRGQSCDSRMWGTVPRGNLIGKVFATYWPPNRVSLH